MSKYSVEHSDEEPMTKFIQTQVCERQVLHWHMDNAVTD